MTDSPSVRSRVPWGRLVFLVLVMGLMLSQVVTTLLLPTRHPTLDDRRRADQERFTIERRERIIQLLADGDGCHPALAHELAKALVFDGQSAREYAADYERRCGADPVIEHWAAAPLPKAQPIASSR